MKRQSTHNNTTGVHSNRAILISAPWAPVEYPSIQVGSLKSYVLAKGFDVDDDYWNLPLADAIGDETYKMFSRYDVPHGLAGEAIYSRLLFPKLQESKSHEKVLARMLKPLGIGAKAFYKYARAVQEISRALVEEYDWRKYKCVGFTLSTHQLMASLYCAGEIKRRSPNIKIIFGGFRCHDELGQWLIENFPVIDYLVPGEGESVLAGILDHEFSDSCASAAVRGAWQRIDGRARWGGMEKRIPNLDAIPYPDYDSYYRRLEECNDLLIDPILPLEASRSCPWGRCRFCDQHGALPTRYHSRKYIEDMALNLTKRYDCLQILFVDHVFPAKQLYGGISKNAIKQLGYIETSARATVDKESLEKMYEIGVRRLTFGFESLSDGGLKQLCKGTTTLDNVQCLKWCKEIGIKVHSNFIFDYPMVKASDIRETFRLIHSLPYKGMMFSWTKFLLLHGSEYHDHPSRYGIRNIRLHTFEKNLFSSSMSKDAVGICYSYDSQKPRPYGLDLRTDSSQWAVELYSHDLFFIDNAHILILYRMAPFTKIEMVDEMRELYLFCDSHRSWAEIVQRFSHLPKKSLAGWLDDWTDKDIIFYHNNRYLALAYRARTAIVP